MINATLPPELWLKILNQDDIDATVLSTIAKVSRALREFSADDSLWRRVLTQDFTLSEAALTLLKTN